jgi:NifU-like protein involved in Fe-S cluster formation
MADIESKDKKNEWFYSDIVKDHFLNPRNIASDDKVIETMKPNGMGQVGSPACGDVMKMWIKVENDRIIDCKWQTFGCASAIASTSMLSVMITEKGGVGLEEAFGITPQDIIARLHGLPNTKIHCSVLGDKALKSAINNYLESTNQKKKKVKD